MDMIYTDINYNELGYLDQCDIDIEIGKYGVATNDLSLKINSNTRDEKLGEGSLIYSNDSEFGGIITSTEVDTSTMTIDFKGKTFRGLLEKEVIQPPNNNAYYVMKGEANTEIEKAIKGKFNDLVVVDNVGLSDIQVNYQTRDINLLQMLEKALFQADIKSRLEIKFYKGKIHLQAIPIVDLSELLQFDQSYGLSMVASTVERNYNHIVALGSGELLDRFRVNLYLKADNTWSTKIGDSAFIGLDRKSYLYEDSNQSDIVELTNNAIAKVDELKGTDKLMINFTSDDAELFEIVGAKEDITGIAFKSQITKKILRGSFKKQIKNVKIEYKVGD